MAWRSTLALLAAATAMAAVVATPIPRALRASRVSAVPEERDAGRTARLFEAHGEPVLGWEVLRAGGASRSDAEERLAIRLLTALGRFGEADSILERASLSSDARTTFLHALQRARLNFDAGRHTRARELLDSSPAPDPALDAYRNYLLVRVNLELGDPAEAARCLERLDTRATPEALRTPVGEVRALVHRALGRPRDALAAANEAALASGDPNRRRAMLSLCYELAWECGDAVEAVRAARRLFDEHRSSDEAGAVALDLLDRGQEVRLSNGALFAGAEVLSARGDAAGLRRALRVLDERRLEGRDLETHRLLWAEYHYQTGDLSRAIALARPSYSDSSLRRRSMLVVARSLRRLGKSLEAAAVYEQFARTFPNDGLTSEALYAAASLHRRGGREAQEARVLDQLRRSYPSTFHGWAAAMRRAEDFSRAGDGAGAQVIYQQWLARSRRTDEAALYYLARERERVARGSGAVLLDELRAVNPYSFYLSPDVPVARGPLRDARGTTLRDGGGSLAEWLARADADRELAYRRVLAASQDSRPAADGETDRAIERGIMFLEAGLRDWAEGELESARRRSGGSAERTLVLARLYEEYAMPWWSVRLYERARSSLSWEERRNHGDDFRFLTHPVPYPGQVLDSAARHDIQPHLVYGMMREESRFEAGAVSRAGAVGLMQLMPHTARRIAVQLDLPFGSDELLQDPSVNVSLGAWYAADLLRAGDGSVAWMLAAYNAGPGAAERWLERGVGGTAAIEAVESIDYRETRGYVKRVVESANVYRALYFAGDHSAGPR